MSGPWEDFQDGPWKQYAKPKAPEPTRRERPPKPKTWLIDDVGEAVSGAARNVARDLREGKSGIATPKTGSFVGDTLATGVNALRTGARAVMDVGNLVSSPITGVTNAVTRLPAEMIARSSLPVAVAPSPQNALRSVLPGNTGGGYRPAIVPEGDIEGRTAAAQEGLNAAVAAATMRGLPSVGPARPSVPRPARLPPVPRPERGAINALATRTQPDVPAMRQRLAEQRTAGLNPAYIDVTDASGRGMVRATAMRQTPARQQVEQLAAQRAVSLPERLGQQARTHLSQDPRTPAQIAEDLGSRRAAQARQEFGAVRGDEVQMAPQTVEALRSDYGRWAITEAAKRERNPEVRASLNRLAADALDNPSTPISVGMADRISRTLHGRANEAARAGDDDLAGLIRGLADDVRKPVAEASTGYRGALDNYAAESRLMEGAERGEDFLARNTDEFVANVGTMSAEERQLAMATARRAIERAAGENVAAAPGVARKIALAPEQQARTNALLGPDRAQAFQNAVQLEERALANVSEITPSRGSKTAPALADTAAAAGNAGQALINASHGNIPGLLANVATWLRSRGMSDVDAEALTRMAIDPARTEEVLALLEARIGRNGARDFLTAAGQLRLQPSRPIGPGVVPSAAILPASQGTAGQ